MSTVTQREVETPLGRLLLNAHEGALAGIWFEPHAGRAAAGGSKQLADSAVLELAARELEEYFAGERREFSVPCAAHGTEFQRRVWAALAGIPFGATRSYLQIAQAIGLPQAVRAVGAANGHNPLPIIVPCHRVIGADGSLTGYGGGLAAKRWLLAHEQAVLSRTAGGQLRLLLD